MPQLPHTVPWQELHIYVVLFQRFEVALQYKHAMVFSKVQSVNMICHRFDMCLANLQCEAAYVF